MKVFLTGVEEKYHPQLLKGRLEIEGNVISCFMKDMLLLDETKLESESFLTLDGLFYFSLLKNLRKKGFYSLDEITILSNSPEDVIERFESCGGWETIQHQIDIINEKNFDTYLDILYRENILIHMHDDGFNLLKEIKINNKKVSPLKLLRKLTAEEVVDWYSARIETYDCGQSSSILEEEEIDFDDKFIESCSDGEENGIDFGKAGDDINLEEINCFPFLSSQINGLLPGTFTMMGGFSSTGKSTWWITVIAALLYRERKVLIITNEENVKKFKMKILVWILGKYCRYYKLTKKKLMSGNITDEDREYIAIAKKYWQENYKGNLKVISTNTSNLSIYKKKIRENVLRYGYDTVLIDTFKLQENDFKGQRQDLALVRDSRELDKIAKKYNLIMLGSVQLLESMKGKLFLDSSVLVNSKQIKEVLENLFFMRNVYEEELDPKSKYFCNPFQLKKVQDKWIEEEYHPDRNAVWRMVFVEKCRSGANSSDTGICYMLKFSGDYAIFRETCQCRPKHGEIK
jgi:KaiC/GvpD/RAD55 family RecA-like ATPase